MNPFNVMFFCVLMLGVMMSISSNSWFSAWLGLEINTLAFIPIMAASFNKMFNEAMLKYFLTQSLASAIMLVPVILMPVTLQMWNNNFLFIILFALIMKLGAAPLHFWMPQVMEGLSWELNIVLTTVQKVAPLYLTMMVSTNLVLVIAMMSSLTGALGGYNQLSMRKIMAYSSISHLGGMLMAAMISSGIMSLYFSIYVIMSSATMLAFLNLNIDHIYQCLKVPLPLAASIMLTMLSLAGLPPFMGFFPKWILIQNLVYFYDFTMPAILIISSLITLFFYFRVSYSMFLMSSFPLMTTKMGSLNLPAFLVSLALCGLPLIIFFIL